MIFRYEWAEAATGGGGGGGGDGEEAAAGSDLGCGGNPIIVRRRLALGSARCR
jgi:hypothetical protein